ncbi:EAL domain-containing protein [Ferriphaselus sp. R-1]|uniref:bifunctional diguanylate cyclase/phosphodiesterase n=1 Tax=Ferriphaselus sp. R-1 TaxID=1485544 RepID=UPI000553F6E8|nr:EAL domain-containing protein [Ferriphaselus sp. R-1]
MATKLVSFLAGSLRKQLILGMVLVIALTMTTFIYVTTLHLRAAEVVDHHEQEVTFTNMLTAASVTVLASGEITDLQVLVDALNGYPDLRQVAILDVDGQILAHTDHSRIGLHLPGFPLEAGTSAISQHPEVREITSPLIMSGQKVGWVYATLDKSHLAQKVQRILISGFLLAVLGTALGVLIAVLASRFLTRRLRIIHEVADAVKAGNHQARVYLYGEDEASQLGRQFNFMLDSIEQHDEQLRSFYECDLVGLTITSPDKGWISINHYLCELLGYSEQELRSMTWVELTYPADLSADLDQFNRVVSGEIDGYSLEKRFISRTGEVIPTNLVVRCIRKENGEVKFITAMVEDIRPHKATEAQIERLALYDQLTHLPNRRLLLDRIRQALASCERSSKSGALLFIDLDNFKTLNDTLGHDMGDLLLQKVAERLTTCVRENDTVARLGGDEFVVMLTDLNANTLDAAAQTKAIADKILALLNQRYQLNSHPYQSTPSIGVTLFGISQCDIDELLKQADIAMYQAKRGGRNTVCFFDPAMQNELNARATLEIELQTAIEQRQFELYFQPQVDHTHRVQGAEALIRWRHPQHGIVFPDAYIPLAEQTGLIQSIGDWMLGSACAQIKSWQNHEATRHLTLSVNVSARQMHHPSFVTNIITIVQRHGIDPRLLRLELTESVLLENMELTAAKMHELGAQGIRFDLDDFGTGYSSLQYLKKLPLHQLKIDQSFVSDIEFDGNDRAIVQTIIAMAQSLNLEVIAEGVETEKQEQILGSMGCLHYQGYRFGKPVPLDEFEQAIGDGKSTA